MQNTANYMLPTYEATDNANLLDGYNEAMDKIDLQMKNNADAVVVAATAANNAKTAADAAQSAAEETRDLAESANSAAQAAQSTASTANSTAQAAQSTASAASSAATKATSTANQALDAANDALATVGKATELVVIGDSYTSGGAGVTIHWPELLKSYAAPHVHVSSADGCGFVNKGTNSKNFGEMLTSIADTISDKTTVGHVIVYGGYNDLNHTQQESAVANAISAFYSSAKSLFPNAKIIMALFNNGWCNLRGDYKGWASNVINQLNGTPFVNMMHILNGLPPEYLTADHLHPANQGQYVVAQEMDNLITVGTLSGAVHVLRYDQSPVQSTFIYSQDGTVKGRINISSQAITDNSVSATIPPDKVPLPMSTTNNNIICAASCSALTLRGVFLDAEEGNITPRCENNGTGSIYLSFCA